MRHSCERLATHAHCLPGCPATCAHRSSPRQQQPQTSELIDDKPAAPAAPASFYCPISMELMADPVMVATGHTYDRVCIEKWLQQGHRTCPATGLKLRHLELVPNHALRNAIQVRGRRLSRTCARRQNEASNTAWRVVVLQEWASLHGVSLSVKQLAAKSPSEEDLEPPSILQVGDAVPGVLSGEATVLLLLLLQRKSMHATVHIGNPQNWCAGPR